MRPESSDWLRIVLLNPVNLPQIPVTRGARSPVPQGDTGDEAHSKGSKGDAAHGSWPMWLIGDFMKGSCVANDDGEEVRSRSPNCSRVPMAVSYTHLRAHET